MRYVPTSRDSPPCSELSSLRLACRGRLHPGLPSRCTVPSGLIHSWIGIPVESFFLQYHLPPQCIHAIHHHGSSRAIVESLDVILQPGNLFMELKNHSSIPSPFSNKESDDSHQCGNYCC